MFSRTRLLAIQEIEEAAFRKLPEEVQNAATMKKNNYVEDENNVDSQPVVVGEAKVESSETETPPKTEQQTVEIPPLLSEEVQEEKNVLLGEGFIGWSRMDYTLFTKASAKHGRTNFVKIASEVGKSEAEISEYVDAFWGEIGKERFSEHEYDRVANLVAKGEKKINEIKTLRRGVRAFIALFDNPWEELEFTHVNTKDKLFSPENDRYLLCWAHKVSFSQLKIKNSFVVLVLCLTQDSSWTGFSSSYFKNHSMASGNGLPSKWRYEGVRSSDSTTLSVVCLLTKSVVGVNT